MTALLLFAINFPRYMWIGPDSLTGFLQLAPDGVSFLFASYGGGCAPWGAAARSHSHICWAARPA